jgi:hypothetical protein
MLLDSVMKRVVGVCRQLQSRVAEGLAATEAEAHDTGELVAI